MIRPFSGSPDMFELIAQGQSPEQRWRKVLDPGTSMELGRECVPLGVNWDSQISRRHVMLLLDNEELVVEKIESAQNPVFFGGVERPAVKLKPGEHFVIGKTTFSLSNERVLPTLDVPSPISQRAFSPQFLRNVEYVDADRRIQVLNQLPGIVSSFGNEKELFTRMVNTLLEGIAPASMVAIFCPGEEEDGEPDREPPTEIVHWDRRRMATGDFSPSERLIRQAVEEQKPIWHIWNQGHSGAVEYTMDVDNDWAFVCPLNGQATRGWGIYVTGKNRISSLSVAAGSKSPSAGSGEVDLQGDVKFCELIASTLTNLLEVQQLERRQSSLRPFFSPIVMDAFSDHEPEEVLTPRECEVAVLFCDLRGFSKASEALADNLLELLDRVSSSLGIMTREILECGGVIGDFHGDAAMGFWGWPLEQQDRSIRAVTAALKIQSVFAAISLDPTHPLFNFSMGVGIATGSAVAGKIGTSDQVKVTAFGPVVNLASRLEGMTKWFGSSILLDEDTANEVKVKAAELGLSWRLQRLGNFLPFGLKTPSQVYRVMAEEEAIKSVDSMAAYDRAILLFEKGEWAEAERELATMPEDNPCRIFLQTHIAQPDYQGKPPNDFGGVIQMRSK
jgi:adenylate cyclase